MSKRFKTFLIIDIVLSVIIAIAGFVVFPLLAWIIDSGNTIFYVLFALFMLGCLLIMMCLVNVIISFIIKKFYTSVTCKNRIIFSNKVILMLSISMIVAFGIHALRFELTDLRETERWGKCLVGDSCVYNMFGFNICCGQGVCKAYSESTIDAHIDQVILLFDFEREYGSNNGTMWIDGKEITYCQNYLKLSATEYDSHGKFMRVLKQVRFNIEKEYEYGRYYYMGDRYDYYRECALGSRRNVLTPICEDYLRKYDIVLVR